jgi:hypothetical protein
VSHQRPAFVLILFLETMWHKLAWNSLCSPYQPQTLSPPIISSQALGLQVCTTTFGIAIDFLKQKEEKGCQYNVKFRILLFPKFIFQIIKCSWIRIGICALEL